MLTNQKTIIIQRFDTYTYGHHHQGIRVSEVTNSLQVKECVRLWGECSCMISYKCKDCCGSYVRQMFKRSLAV